MRLIDADALDNAFLMLGYDQTDLPRMMLERMPAIAAVTVVRCKDCKRNLLAHSGDYSTLYCGKFLFYPKPDHFCSYGEREE